MNFGRFFKQASQTPHPLVAELLAGFEQWNSRTMAWAISKMLERYQSSGMSSTAYVKLDADLDEMLFEMLCHPVQGINPIERPVRLILSLQYEPEKKSFSVRFLPDPSDPNSAKWHSLGFRFVGTVPRDRVKPPFPLPGEPGFDLDRVRSFRPREPRPGLPDFRFQDAWESKKPGELYRRYMGGEEEQVWSELNALGADVRSPHWIGDAAAVAHETMRRARSNIETLVERLTKMGMIFGDPPFEPPPRDILRRIAALESEAGPLPLSLGFYFMEIGSVSLVGTHPDLEWSAGDAHYPDALETFPSTYALKFDEEQLQEEGRYFIELSRDEYHKDDVSGGDCYQIAIPELKADGPLLYEWHETSFVGYLRECFRSGGFPGLSERISNVAPELLNGLLPL